MYFLHMQMAFDHLFNCVPLYNIESRDQGIFVDPGVNDNTNETHPITSMTFNSIISA